MFYVKHNGVFLQYSSWDHKSGKCQPGTGGLRVQTAAFQAQIFGVRSKNTRHIVHRQIPADEV
ncbi:unnamed protein product, partial [Nesidiocoris tenuis]